MVILVTNVINGEQRIFKMQKDKEAQKLQQMLDIKDGKQVSKTTEKSNFNKELEANRPTHTYYKHAPKGRMLTQHEMARIRHNEQIWPDGVQHDADFFRDFQVK